MTHTDIKLKILLKEGSDPEKIRKAWYARLNMRSKNSFSISKPMTTELLGVSRNFLQVEITGEDYYRNIGSDLPINGNL